MGVVRHYGFIRYGFSGACPISGPIPTSQFRLPIPSLPELEDFGELNVVGANGASYYHRVDWLTQDGLGTDQARA